MEHLAYLSKFKAAVGVSHELTRSCFVLRVAAQVSASGDLYVAHFDFADNADTGRIAGHIASTVNQTLLAHRMNTWRPYFW